MLGALGLMNYKLKKDEMPMRKLHTQGNDYTGHSPESSSGQAIWQLKSNYNQMKSKSFQSLIYLFLFLGFFLTSSLNGLGVIAQQNSDLAGASELAVRYNKLIIRNLGIDADFQNISDSETLKIQPLTIIEENVARNLNSNWVWPEYTLDMIDSYSPFLFRTKKSQDLSEVKVLVHINSKGKVSGFEVINEVDKGTKERLDHMIRKLPSCKPVPGFSNYSPERFELTIKR
jgi:hypothetical protein